MKQFMKLCSVTLVILMLLAACGGGADGSPQTAATDGAAPANDGVITIRAGSVTADDHPYNHGLRRFAELVAEYTDGRYQVEVFSNSQLGSEKEMIESMQMGTLELALVSTSPLNSFTDAFMVTDLPFLFTDKEHAYRVLDGEIGREIFDSLEGTGLKGMSYWESGFRHVTNSKHPVETVADMARLKIRVMENQIHIDSFRELGCDPTPMAFGELFTALQQKTVDGEESPLATIMTSKFYEVQPFITMTGHFYPPAPLLMSQSFWNSLSDADKEAFQRASNEARDYERQVNQEMEDQLEQELKELGMEFVYPDKTEWQAAMQPIYEKYSDQLGAELIQRIQDA